MEVGVCLDSDICEERLLELKRPLTKLPRRRAGVDGGERGCRPSMQLGRGYNTSHYVYSHICVCKGSMRGEGGEMFHVKKYKRELFRRTEKK